MFVLFDCIFAEIGLYSELGGCLKEMDVIVKAFVSTTNPDERAKLYNDALMQSKTYTQPYQHESTGMWRISVLSSFASFRLF